MKSLFKLFIVAIFFTSCGKDEVEVKSSKTIICESKRYTDSIFAEVAVSTVKYGNNINSLGLSQDLNMDIYQPKGDTLSKRPVVVLAYGGSFVSGDRRQLADLAKEMTKLGYVAACIDYRLLSFNQLPFDSVKGLDIAIKAAMDLKAAVRHLRKDAATTNTFRIDPDMIIAAGVSAGAITAIQAAYFDESDNIENHIKVAIEKNGGVEGNSGDAENLKYSSKIQGVINMSGAVYRPYFLDKGEAPIASFQGDKDEVVPYGYDYVNALGIKIIKLYGSSEIDKRTKSEGITSYFQTAKNGGHTNIYSDAIYAIDFTTFKTAAYKFTKDIICK